MKEYNSFPYTQVFIFFILKYKIYMPFPDYVWNKLYNAIDIEISDYFMNTLNDTVNESISSKNIFNKIVSNKSYDEILEFLSINY